MRYFSHYDKRVPLFNLAVLTAAFVFAFINQGFSRGMDVRMDVHETGIWNSNPLMLRGGEKTIMGSETAASLNFIGNFLKTEFDADVSVSQTLFNESDFNSTDFSGQGGVVWNSPLWRAALDGRINYDTTRTSELTTFGLDVGSVRHFSFLTQPEISYNFSQRGTLSLAGSWLESRYETSSLSDYRTVSLTPSLIYNVTALQQALLSFNMQRYRSLEDKDIHIDSFGPSLGALWSFSPTLSADASVGFRGSKTYGIPLARRKINWDYVFSTGLSYRDEQNALKLSAERRRQSFANTSETYLTNFSLGENYRVNPKLSVNFNANYQFAEQDSSSVGGLDTSWSGASALSYKVTKHWDVNTSYRYRRESLTGSNRDADQNVVRVGLSYRSNLKRKR